SIVFSESTGNAAATMTKAIPDGSYWWHVRAISKSGQISGWSSPRSLRKAWTGSPRLLSPVRGKKVDFPSTALTLSWTAVPRAATYLVSIATDESLSSLVGGRAVETAAVSASPQLTPGSKSKTYYWAITPVDAEGNKGKQSRVEHFEWAWRSTTKVHWINLRKD